MFNSFVIACVRFVKQPASASFLLHPAFHQSSDVNGVSLDLQACRKSEKNQAITVCFDKSNHYTFWWFSPF